MNGIEKELLRIEHSIRTELHREMNAQTWKIVGTFAAIATVTYFLARNVAPPAPPPAPPQVSAPAAPTLPPAPATKP